MSLLKPIITLLLLLGLNQLGAQPASSSDQQLTLEAGSAALDEVYAKDQDIYDFLMDGPMYGPSHFRVTGHPYFLEDSLYAGSLEVNAVVFSDLLLKYDLYQDVLVYLPASARSGMIALNPDRIHSFTIGGRFFIHVRKFPAAGPNLAQAPKPGFFELLHSGQITVLAKRVKRFTESIKSPTNLGEYWSKDAMYLIKNEQVFALKKKKDLLMSLSDQEEALRSYIKQKRFKLRLARPLEFVQLFQYYESL